MADDLPFAEHDAIARHAWQSPRGFDKHPSTEELALELRALRARQDLILRWIKTQDANFRTPEEEVNGDG